MSMWLKVINTGSQYGNCYALMSGDEEILLLDCGCKYREILRGIDYRIADVAGCLLTHIHGDHAKSYKNLTKNGIEIYSNNDTVRHFGAYDPIEYFDLGIGGMIGKKERKPFECGSFNVIPFYLPHTTKDKDTGEIIPCPNFGYFIQHKDMGSLVYMTDFEYPTLSFRSAKINHLLCEVNYCEEFVDKSAANFEHRLKGHLSFETFKEKVLKQNMTDALKTVTICHLSDAAADEQMILNQTKEITGNDIEVNIAKGSLCVNLNYIPF